MFSVLAVVLPIFALIFSGWLARRINVLGDHATTELNRFVVYLALPALLIDIMANAQFSDIWHPAFIATFGLGMMIIFIITIFIRLPSGHLADCAIDGLNSAYANTGFMGFPLALAVFGKNALAPTMISAILTVCVLFGLSLILIEISLQTERRPLKMISKVLRSLIRNPLIVSPFLGALFMIFDIPLSSSIQTFLKLLGGAASPCALVALGLFLAEKQENKKPAYGAISLLVILKLFIHPLITWIIAKWVFDLSPFLTNLAMLLSALPTGTGSFMVAKFYNREASITSNTVLISTIASLITITIYLMMIR